MLLISGFYLFGAVVLLVGMLFNPVGVSRVIAERHGLPGDTGLGVIVVVVALALAVSYGLYSLSRWGFLLTVAYLCYFGAVSLYLTSTSTDQVFIGNFIWSALVLIYLFFTRGTFFSSETGAHRR